MIDVNNIIIYNKQFSKNEKTLRATVFSINKICGNGKRKKKYPIKFGCRCLKILKSLYVKGVVISQLTFVSIS